MMAEAMGWVSRPYFDGVYAGVDGGLPPGTWTKITMTSILLDSHGWWDPGNFRYVPKRAGKYLVIWQAELTEPTGQLTHAYADIWLNGAGGRDKHIIWNGTNKLAVPQPITAQAILAMNGSTDYVEPYVYVIGGSPNVVGGSISRFIVCYMGP
jgi:hypothetical protein